MCQSAVVRRSTNIAVPNVILSSPTTVRNVPIYVRMIVINVTNVIAIVIAIVNAVVIVVASANALSAIVVLSFNQNALLGAFFLSLYQRQSIHLKFRKNKQLQSEFEPRLLKKFIALGGMNCQPGNVYASKESVVSGGKATRIKSQTELVRKCKIFYNIFP